MKIVKHIFGDTFGFYLDLIASEICRTEEAKEYEKGESSDEKSFFLENPQAVIIKEVFRFRYTRGDDNTFIEKMY